MVRSAFVVLIKTMTLPDGVIQDGCGNLDNTLYQLVDSPYTERVLYFVTSATIDLYKQFHGKTKAQKALVLTKALNIFRTLTGYEDEGSFVTACEMKCIEEDQYLQKVHDK